MEKAYFLPLSGTMTEFTSLGITDKRQIKVSTVALRPFFDTQIYQFFRDVGYFFRQFPGNCLVR